MKLREKRLTNSSLADQREVIAFMRGVSNYCDDLSRIVIGISFEVRQGEVFGLLGPSGSGNSTTLKILAGRLRPIEGKVKVFGRSPRRRATKARIGYLPDRAAYDRSHKIFDLLGILWGRAPGRRKSAGEPAAAPRRTELAQALLKNPDLVILDEPFSALDPVACREMKDLILTLARRGKTVIFSGDSLLDAKAICDRVAIFFDGKIQAIGSLDEVLAMPDAVRFTAPLLSWAMSERLLEIIREDVAERRMENFENASLDAMHASSAVEPSLAETAAEKILAPLAKFTTPKPASKSPDTIVDLGNHKTLLKLVKAQTDASQAVPAVNSNSLSL